MRLYVLIICVWSIACISYGVNVCRKECNDGGCAYTDKSGAYKGCDCLPFNRAGSECELYSDVCESKTFKPCKNNGKCVSSLGSAYCDCSTGYHGTKCRHLHNDSSSNYPKRPSLYYRTKVRPGELVYTYVIIENDETFRYTFQLINHAVGTAIANFENNELMTTDRYHSICINQMGSNDFPMNKNMCDFVKTTYGNSKINVLNQKPYFMSKTRVKRNDVYYNGDRNAGRMGGTYMISVKIYDVNQQDELLSYDFYHLVIDDELSNCLPFIDPGENCNTNYAPLKVKRSEDVPTVKIIVTPDNELCNKSFEYDYEWKVVDGHFPMHYVDEYNEIEKPTKVINIDDKTLRSRDLAIQQYTLPEGPLILKLKLSIKKNQESDLKKYVSNRYLCYVDVSLDNLHAEIVGDSVKQVSNFDLVTLDASPSYNPNEPKNRQDQMLYIWHCNVDADEENCREYKTNNPVRTLLAPLNKAKKYIFKLITRVNNDYMEHIGKPKEGTATVTLLPKLFVFDVSIKCIKNCGYLSNPLDIVYLEAETHCKNCSFDWYYKEESDSTFISTKTIKELNTPHYVFIAIKRSLGFNKAYTFKAEDQNSKLGSSIFIRTAAEPIAGECHVNPTSGIAGMTLFTIACSNFKDVYGIHSLSYYYYERYESDQDGLGFLINHGSDKLSNIKLSISGKLSVLVINSFGVYTQVNISVQIFKSNTSQLVEKLKIMKSELLNGNISATVQVLSVICDILVDRKIKDGFSTLLHTISKIPSEGCIFCIEQTVLALKKVVHAYSEVNGHKIIPIDALSISKNLLITISNHFEYLKFSQNDEVIAEVDRTERIYKSFKNILDILIREVDPILYKNDTGNSSRYFWSSLEYMTLVTRNVEETLKIFGESILLHQVTFEKHKIYESADSYFWANMFNADMLKKENSIINYNLANELLVNKEIAWGFKIFEINKKLMVWTEKRRHFNGIKSSVKYVALSAHDRNTRKYLRLIDNFDSPASIIFNVTETIDEFDVEYTIHVPTAGSEQIEFDKAIRVFRLDMLKVGAIFITIKKSSHALLVAWTKNKRPDFKLMSDEQYVKKISVNGYHNLTFLTRKDNQNDIHYIGIYVDTAVTSINNSFDVKFKMNTLCMQCLYWKNTDWSSEGMEIGINSSIDGNVNCNTYHFSLFSSSIYVPPNLLNPIDDIHLFSTITNNMVCLILLAIIFIIYIVLLYWSNVKDKFDIFISRIIILHDNFMDEDEVYLVTVYTGYGIGSGTTASVCIELNGTFRSSRVHWLHSPYYRTLQRSNDDWFLIFTPQTLGELQSIHIWHDNYGKSPDWYCQRIIVTEIRSDKTWMFEVERWFTLCRPVENIEHIIYTTALNPDWKKHTKEYFGSGIREKHLWASVFIRHPRSSITRCQRLSVNLCAVLSMMLSSMMFYGTLHTDEEEFGKFEMRLREFTIALQSLIVQIILTFSVLRCFIKGRQIQLNKIMDTRSQKKLIQDNKPKSTLKKIFDFIAARVMVDKNVYYPANIEPIIERYQWNHWFIIGWIYSVTVYISTTYFIILYGLKFGRIKSLCWLTSITFGIFNGVIVLSPFKIILISVMLAMYSSWKKEQTLEYKYNLTLSRYRKKKLILSQDFEFIKLNRKIRRRRFYLPLTSKAVDILRHQRILAADRKSLIIDVIICAIIILTSLCCVYHFNVFDKQNDKYRTSRIVSEYLDCVLFESDDRRTSLDNLKELLSFKLLKTLHSLELYNGMPITNDMAETIEYYKRGWFGLYHSRLINGDVILKQWRVKSNGENDDGSYSPGWTRRIEVDNGTTPWSHFKSYTQDFLFFKNLLMDDTLTGYELHLTGGLVESKSTMDEYLKLKWLDEKTRRLLVQFQIYTPNVDLVTMVQIQMTTDCGFQYTINTDAVQSVPASSVIIADRVPYAFTASAVGALIAASAACLLARVFRTSDRGWRTRSFAYDALLAALAVIAVAALARRLSAMERTTAELVAGVRGDGDGPVDLRPAFRSHVTCTRCAAVLAAAALMRLSATLRRAAVASRR